MSSLTISNNKRLENSYNFWFYLFASMHALMWVLVPYISYYNTYFDVAENISLGRQWQLGYSKHPPLAHWVTAAVYQLTGSPEVPIYILSQASIFLCFWTVWRLAKKILSPAQALVGVLCLEGIYYFSVRSSMFNENIILLPLWALSIWYFYHALQDQKIKDWLFTGVFIGLAFIAKYETIVLIVTILTLLLQNPQARISWRKPGLYLAGFISLLIVIPNLIWLVQHDFISLKYASHRIADTGAMSFSFLQSAFVKNHLFNPLKFIAEQSLALLPLFLLLLPFRNAEKSDRQIKSFDKYFLAMMAWGPALVTLSMSMLLGMRIYAMWAVPFFCWVGVWWLAQRDPAISPVQLRVFGYSVAILLLMVGLLRIATLGYGPYIRGRVTQAHFPGDLMAQQLTQLWQHKYNEPLTYVAGPRVLVENISVYSPDAPTPYFDWIPEQNLWIKEEDLYTKGALFVWKLKPGRRLKLPMNLAQRYPEAKIIGIRDFPYHTDAKSHFETLHKFLLIAVLSFLMNESLYYLLLNKFNIYYSLALLIVLVIVPPFTFTMSKIWAFRQSL